MYIVHDVPGRLRVKLEKLKNNPYRLNLVKTQLMIDGVHRIKSSEVTGSVVIEYDKLSATTYTFIDIFQENGYIMNSQMKNDRLAQIHEKIASILGKATFSFLACRVLETNGLAYIAAFI